MKLSEIMTRRPLVVSPDAPPAELERLVHAARVRHLPLMEGDDLVGLWLATDDGPLVLLGPESVHRTAPDADAEEAIREIVAGREAAIAFEEGRPVGMLTRTDVLGILRAALARGVGTASIHPVVVVLTGSAGAGKSTLLLRTIPLLRECEAGVVRADAPPGTAPSRSEVAGVPSITDPAAAFRRGLQESVRALGDVQVVLVEDRDRDPGAPGVPGGDIEVLVVPAADVAAVGAAAVREAQAVVVTKLDAPGADLGALRDALHAHCPGIPVFGVAAAVDDRGLAEWRDWLVGQVLHRGHR